MRLHLTPATGVAVLGAIAALIRPSGADKFMIVGDSISHGFEGDYTWRYRLWEWFQSNGIAVDFVGPYTGTNPPDPASPPSPPALQGAPAETPEVRTSGGYAVDVSSGFDKDHFCVWGRQAAQDKSQIAALVSQYQPDYLLVELGFNDLGWFVSGPEGTLDSMKTLIDNARSAKSNLKFAVANVPYRTYIGGRDDLPVITDQYNALLADAIPQWTTSTSPIKLVKFRENYSCELDGCPAGHDGLHPNALGEYQIASAFTKVLHDDFGFGESALSVPSTVPARPCTVPTNFKVSSEGFGMVVTWDKMYGAFSYDVQSQVNGGGWTTAANYSSANRFNSQWAIDGATYEYKVRAFCGDPGIYSDFTASQSGVAHPQTAPGPENIVVHATADGYTASWDAVSGATLYELWTYDLDCPSCFLTSVGIQGTSATVSDLTPEHHHVVAISTWNSIGGGFPAVANSVRVGYIGAPPVPTDIQVLTVDEGATVHVKWTGSIAASGYKVWSRNVNNDTDILKTGGDTTDGWCHGVTFLFPGAWNYEFCVSAFNGNDESAKSTCVIAPKDIVADEGGDTCAPPAVSDPGGIFVPVPTASNPGSLPTNTPSVSSSAPPSSITNSPSAPDPTAIYIPDPTCESVSVTAWGGKPTDLPDSEPIDAQGYFYIGNSCYRDTNVEGFANKAEFYKTAYKDAIALADSTLDWPQLYGKDASDLYFGKTTEEPRYSDTIHENLNRVAKWLPERGWFDDYIVLECADKNGNNGAGHGGSCSQKIGGDSRAIACWVNNTKPVAWWWKSYITCCDTFFQTTTLDVQYKNNQKYKDNLDLRYLRSSGEYLLHELMHTLEITGKNGERPHIIDEVFDGSRGRRIYGPVDVAKAARMYGPSRTQYNADSYAQFASAHYWQKRFGTKVPQPSVHALAPADAINADLISDSDTNFEEYCVTPPSDFNCGACTESGCGDEAAPCCANGSCKCDCDESGCSADSPGCCASGTCLWGS